MARKRRKHLVPPVGMDLSHDDTVLTLVGRAVRLFFQDKDMLSAHLLASSVLEMVHGKMKKNNMRSLIDLGEYALEGVDSDRKEFMDASNRVTNRLKHYNGKRDEGIKNYRIWETETRLLMMSLEVMRVYGALPETALFVGWFTCRHPDFPVDGDKLSGAMKEWAKFVNTPTVRSKNLIESLEAVAKMLRIFDSADDYNELPEGVRMSWSSGMTIRKLIEGGAFI